MIDSSEFIKNLLPYELLRDGNSVNFKKLLAVYGGFSDSGYAEEESYGNILDIIETSGSSLDNLGNMFYVSRNIGESDDLYRDRILNTNIERKTPVSIPEIQEAIDSIVTEGKLSILENYNGRNANVYITGTANESSIIRAISAIGKFMPTGVALIIPVVSFSSWESVSNQFSTWESIQADEYIW